MLDFKTLLDMVKGGAKGGVAVKKRQPKKKAKKIVRSGVNRGAGASASAGAGKPLPLDNRYTKRTFRVKPKQRSSGLQGNKAKLQGNISPRGLALGNKLRVR